LCIAQFGLGFKTTVDDTCGQNIMATAQPPQDNPPTEYKHGEAMAAETSSVKSNSSADSASTTSSTTSSNMAEGFTPKPSIGQQLELIDDFVAAWKITSTSGHISHLLKTRKIKVRLACLVAIFENYQVKGSLHTAQSLMAAMPQVLSFFSFVKDLMVGGKIVEATPQEAIDANSRTTSCLNAARLVAMQADGIEDIEINPLAPISEQPEILQQADKLMPVLRPLLGFAAVMVASMGVGKLLKMKWLGSTARDLVALAGVIKAKNVVVDEANKCVDTLLTTVYSAFGGTYVDPKMAKIKEVNRRIMSIVDRTNRYVDGTKTDVFGLIRNQSVRNITKTHESLLKEVMMLTEQERSLFNMMDSLRQVRRNLDVIRERKNALLQSGGKQEPVKIWIYGSGGVGKSRMAQELAQLIEPGAESYTRQPSDKFFSGYVGHQFMIMDDILQNPNSSDANEWMGFSTEAARNVPMAELDEKGMMFTSDYLIGTSNFSHLHGHAEVSSLMAFDRRRDYLVRAYNPALDEYKKRHGGQNPPPEWFQANPTRLYLYNPIAIHCGMQYDLGPPNPANPAFLGEVTLEQLAVMCKELRKQYAEKYRQSLLRRGVQEYVTVPPEIKYDTRLSDLTKIYDEHKMRRYDVTNPQFHHPLFPPLPNDDDEDMSQLTQEEEEEEAPRATEPEANIVPVVLKSYKRAYGLILEGPPGIGKTSSLEQFFTVNKLPSVVVTHQMVVANPNWLAEVLGRGIILMDDFTASPELNVAFQTTLIAYAAGRVNAPGLIGTYNKESEVWKATPKHDREKIMRRSTHVTFGMPSKYHASQLIPGFRRSVEDYLKEHKRENCVTITCKNKIFESYVTLQAAYYNFFKAAITQERIATVGAFTIPMPTDFDVYVQLPPGLIMPPAPARKVLEKITNSKIAMRENGKWRKPTRIEVFTNLLALAPMFSVTEAYGDLETFVRIFNAEAHKAPLPFHCLVEVPEMGFLGFMGIDGRTVGYAVDRDCEQTLEFRQGEVYLDGSETAFDEHNTVYKHALMRAFGETTTSVKFEPTEAQYDAVRQLILRETPLGQILQVVVPAVSLSIKGMAVLSFFGTIDEHKHRPRRGSSSSSDESSSDTEEESHPVKQERKKNFAPPKDKVNTDGEKKDKSSNNVRPERKKNFATPKDKVNTDGEKKDKASNNVRPERKKNFEAPKKKITTDPETNDKASNNIRCEHKRRSRRPRSQVSDGDWQDDATDDENYDPQRRTAQPHVVTAEALDRDGTIVLHENGTYGFLYSGAVVYADEMPIGTFNIIMGPRSHAWKVVPHPTDMHVQKKHEKVAITFHQKTICKDTVENMLSTTHYFAPDDKMDFSSVFAYSMATGIPYDATNRELCPKVAVDAFHPNYGVNMPEYMRSFIKSHFKKVPLTSTLTKPEGMYDPQLSQAVRQVTKSTVSILYNGQHCVYGLCIGKDLIITVAHVSELEDLTFAMHDKYWSLEFLQRNKKCDLAVFRCPSPQFPAMPNIAHLFAKSEDIAKTLSRSQNKLPGYLSIPPRADVPYATNMACEITALTELQNNAMNGRSIHYSAVVGSLCVTGVSARGDCGSLLFLQNKTIPGKLIGLHRAGSSSLSVSSLITQEWIVSILSKPEALVTEACVAEPLSTLTVPNQIKLEEQYKTCNTTGLLWAGRLEKAIYTPDKTRIHRTGFVFPEYDVYQPSIMNSDDPRAEGWRALDDGLRRYGTPGTKHTPDQEKINEVFLQIGQEYADKINQAGRQTRVFTKTEAVNTPDQNEYTNPHPIDRTGSAGFPHVLEGGKSKKDYLQFNEKNQKWYFKHDVASQQLSSKISQIVQDAKNNVEHLHPFIAYLKDEPLKLKKVTTKKKTRLFFSGSFEYLVAFRMYFLSGMLRCMELYRSVPAKVGISNSMSDWHLLTSQLLKVSSFGFASDVENFDSSVPEPFLKGTRLVHDVIYRETAEPGTDHIGDAKVRKVLHSAIEGAYVISRKSLYKLLQAQISGNPGTALENSWIMWALYALCWNDLAQVHDPMKYGYTQFRKYVYLACYGDDNICSVSPDAPWFNFNTFKERAQHYGFKITDAAKVGGDVPDFVPVMDLEFLKRGFKKIQGWYVGPLELNSIAKSIMWIRQGAYKITEEHIPQLGGSWPVANDNDLISDSVDQAWAELALHGEDTYNTWRRDIVKQAHNINVTISAPSWKEAMARKDYLVYSAQSLST